MRSDQERDYWAVRLYNFYRDAKPGAPLWLDLSDDEREAWRVAAERFRELP
jgi:hypothetical protein